MPNFKVTYEEKLQAILEYLMSAEQIKIRIIADF